MGRYSSVQAYADSNTNMRTVSYDQAAGSAAPKTGGVKPEKVDNPYGSTAGAGSGEFHIYRHARAREKERWKQLDEEEREQILQQEYKETLETYKTEEERKTAQRRKKRQRQKEAKMRKKNLQLVGVAASNENNSKAGAEDDQEEFSYIPEQGTMPDQQSREVERNGCGDETIEEIDVAPQVPSFANDGSFLEQMKQKMAEEVAGSYGAHEDDEDNDDEEGPMPKKRAL